MKKMRLIGSTIKSVAADHEISLDELGKAIGCDRQQMDAVILGRKICSFDQIRKIADKCEVPVKKILDGDEAYYNQNIVHCMNDFQNEENREDILDIIYDYLDVYDSVNK